MIYQDLLASYSGGKVARSVGIPDTKLVFDFKPKSQEWYDRMSFMMTPFSDVILSGGIEKGIIELDRYSGGITKFVEFDNLTGSLLTFRHNGRYIVVGHYVLDISSLEIVYNSWPLIDQSGYTLGRGNGFINDRYMVREINVRNHPGVWFILDLDTMTATLRDMGASWPCMVFGDNDRVICVINDSVHIRSLNTNLTIKESLLQNISLVVSEPSGIKVCCNENREKYLLNSNTMEVMGKLGRFNWINDLCFENFHDSFSPLSLSYGSSRNYPEVDFGCYHWRKKEVLWMNTYTSGDKLAIGGDLFFTAINRSRVIALDKWTGKQVWEADESYDPVSFHFYGKHLYMMNMEGGLRCYEWKEEYISPNRPTSLDDVWIMPELNI